jgi:hypothetical protein
MGALRGGALGATGGDALLRCGEVGGGHLGALVGCDVVGRRRRVGDGWCVFGSTGWRDGVMVDGYGWAEVPWGKHV